jgi:hypothetical protein
MLNWKGLIWDNFVDYLTTLSVSGLYNYNRPYTFYLGVSGALRSTPLSLLVCCLARGR